MKQVFLTLIAATICIAATTTSAQADVLTFTFDPNDLIDQYEPGVPTSSSNPRSVRLGGYDAYTGVANWSGSVDEIEEDYLAWRDDNGGYIRCFNTWLADGGAAKQWGENVVIPPGSMITATAAEGWTVEIIENPWRDGMLMAQWSTDDPAYYLKVGGADIGEFSFTADVYLDGGDGGYDEGDTPAPVGEYTIWLGGENGDSAHPHDPVNETYPNGVVYYQATMKISGTPEPASFAIWGLLAVIGMAVTGRRRR